MQLTIGALPAGPAVAECIETALRDDVPALLGEMGYDPFGWPRLRTAIAAYLDRLGVPTHPDQILVTNGAQQAVHLVASHLGGPEARSSSRTPPTSVRSTPSARPAIV